MKKVFSILLLILGLGLAANAQGYQIKGVVEDALGPVIGATVLEQGTTTGTSTGLDGDFILVVSGPDAIVEVSCMGYASRTFKASELPASIMLAEDSEYLDDVVVIGYGSQKKKEVTGSVVSLKSDDFDKGAFTSAAGMLQGKVAGLSVTNPDGGDPNASYEILLRGTNTLSAGQGPLIIIDGVVGADIRTINFQEVESIDVLKDGSAAAIYGTRGTNGVLIITTKRAKAGTTSVNYEGQVSVQTVRSRAMPMTAEQFENTINTYRPENKNKLYGANTDWFDAVTRTPVSHKHNLAITGGSDKFSHRTVINIENNQGILKRRSRAGWYSTATSAT